MLGIFIWNLKPISFQLTWWFYDQIRNPIELWWWLWNNRGLKRTFLYERLRKSWTNGFYYL